MGPGQSGRASVAVRRRHRPGGPRDGPHPARLVGSYPGGVRRRRGRYGVADRDATRRPGPHQGPASLRLHRQPARADRRAPAGHVRTPQEHDARSDGLGAACATTEPIHRGRPADGPSARADHGQAPDPRWARDGPARVLRPRQGATGRAARRLPMAQARPQGRAGRCVARRLPVAGNVPDPAGHHARRASAQDARRVPRRGRRRQDEGAARAQDDLLPGPHARIDRRARGAA